MTGTACFLACRWPTDGRRTKKSPQREKLHICKSAREHVHTASRAGVMDGVTSRADKDGSCRRSRLRMC
jgi:hypothetical protein